MTEPTMVERAARAMAFNWPAPAWTDEFSEERRDYWRAKARAAIATMPIEWLAQQLEDQLSCLSGRPKAWQYAVVLKSIFDAALAPAPEGTGTGEMG